MPAMYSIPRLRLHLPDLQDGALAGVLALALQFVLFSATSTSLAQEIARKNAPLEEGITLVRVDIMTETKGPAQPLLINGRRIPDYRPKIIHIFPSTGVVMDDKGHVLTFLGYRYADLQQTDPRVQIITRSGERHKGRLVGIDQVLGVAVVSSLDGKLQRTLVCRNCELSGGDIVVAPIDDAGGDAQFVSAQILSVGEGNTSNASASWNITVNRKLPGAGEVLLDEKRRVLGFVASQRPSGEDPMGLRTMAYPITELLSSAEKIIKAGGNIRNGWLGVDLDYDPRQSVTGIRIKGVKEDSPAQRAGLRPQDTILKWNGEEIRDAMQFIRLVQESPIGSKVSLNVLRDGKPSSLQALIQPRRTAERPGRFIFNFPDHMDSAPDYGLQNNVDEPTTWPGIEAAPLTAQMAEFMKLPTQAGVLVLNVDSPLFSSAGVQAGDVILAVNGQEVDTPQTLFARLKLYSRNTQQVMLKMLRKGAEQVTTIQLPLTARPPRSRKKE